MGLRLCRCLCLCLCLWLCLWLRRSRLHDLRRIELLEKRTGCFVLGVLRHRFQGESLRRLDCPLIEMGLGSLKGDFSS